MTVRRVGLMVLLWACVCTSGTALANGLESKAQRLVDRALLATQLRHEGCLPGAATTRERTWTSGVIEPALLALVGLLRREQTWEERDVARWSTPDTWPGFAPVLFHEGTRIATAADGSRYVVTVGLTDQNLFEMTPSYDQCAAWRRDRLIRMLDDQPRKLRRRALALDAKLTRSARPRPLPPTTVSITPESRLYPLGLPFEAERFRRDGVYLSDRRRYYALLPDGVATVTATFERRSTGRRSVRTAAVRDNVVSIAAPPRMEPMPVRMEWRDRNGSILNVIEPEVFLSDFAR
jgi:hypothetical protein